MTAMITPETAVAKGFDHAVALISATLEVGEDPTEVAATVERVASDLIVAQQKVLDQVRDVFGEVTRPEPASVAEGYAPAPATTVATVPPVPPTPQAPNPQRGAPGSLTEGYDRPFSSSRGQVKACYGKLIALQQKLGKPDPLTSGGMPMDLWVDYFAGRRNGKPNWKALEGLSKFAAGDMIARVQLMLDGNQDPGPQYQDPYWSEMESQNGGGGTMRGAVAAAAAAKNGDHVEDYEAPF